MSTFNLKDFLDDQLSLEDDWLLLVEKYKPLWKDLAEDLAEVEVFFADNLIEKNALGLTQKTADNFVRVLFWSILTKADSKGKAIIDDDTYYETLLHEMCHCAAFFTDGSLDHGSTWQYFVNKLNNCGYNITQENDFL